MKYLISRLQKLEQMLRKYMLLSTFDGFKSAKKKKELEPIWSALVTAIKKLEQITEEKKP